LGGPGDTGGHEGDLAAGAVPAPAAHPAAPLDDFAHLARAGVDMEEARAAADLGFHGDGAVREPLDTARLVLPVAKQVDRLAARGRNDVEAGVAGSGGAVDEGELPAV